MVIPEKNRAAYEEAIKSQWNGKCTVYAQQKSVNLATGATELEPVAVLVDALCHLCFVSQPATSDNRGAPALTQSIRLHIDAAAEVPPGAKIVVTQNNVTEAYSHSGLPAIYTVHKEITLVKWGGWA
jgi:hypothetical protein